MSFKGPVFQSPLLELPACIITPGFFTQLLGIQCASLLCQTKHLTKVICPLFEFSVYFFLSELYGIINKGDFLFGDSNFYFSPFEKLNVSFPPKKHSHFPEITSSGGEVVVMYSCGVQVWCAGVMYRCDVQVSCAGVACRCVEFCFFTLFPTEGV